MIHAMHDKVKGATRNDVVVSRIDGKTWIIFEPSRPNDSGRRVDLYVTDSDVRKLAEKLLATIETRTRHHPGCNRSVPDLAFHCEEHHD